MRAVTSILALSAALVATGAQAQVVSRSVSEQPVETIVTQTPNGTVITRRPVGDARAESVDAVVTREVVRRVETRPARRLESRPVGLSTQPVPRHKAARRTDREVVTRTTIRRPVPVIALSPAERRIVYQTIVEREVVPPPRVIAPAWGEPLVTTPPVVAQDEDIELTAPGYYRVGAVLPQNVPLFAVPQDVAYRVPAAQPYSYAYVDGRAYLVDPGSGVIVADVTE